jgi:hypothetical protein
VTRDGGVSLRNALAARNQSFISTCRDRSPIPPAGIPWLRFIRQRLGSRVYFWPFDGRDIPAWRSVVMEVYPSLWSRNFACEGRDPDQHDAYSAAAWMRRADLEGSLAAFLNPSLGTPERAVAQVEGWILGVA